jgi:hypothetical protein
VIDPLTKKQRNDLFELIKGTHFDPFRFKLSRVETNTYVNEIYKKDTYELRVDISPVAFLIATDFKNEHWEFASQRHDCILTDKGVDTPAWPTWTAWTDDFTKVKESFANWLQTSGTKYFAYMAEKEEDDNTPDLWAELDLPAGAAEDLQALPNTRFSPEEQTRIADALSEFEKEVKTRDLLSADQIKLLHQKVEYLIDSSKRLGRKDWINAGTGALFGFTLQAGLSGETATQIFHLAAAGLQWIVVHLPMLPPVAT